MLQLREDYLVTLANMALFTALWYYLQTAWSLLKVRVLSVQGHPDFIFKLKYIYKRYEIIFHTIDILIFTYLIPLLSVRELLRKMMAVPR